jgi:valyl-tRNA synthetase
MPAEDRWILSRLERLTGNADRLMERFELGEAGREMEEFLWDEFCDWYLEIAKIRLRSGDALRQAQDEKASPMPVLVHVLDTCLRLLHPYMPYVTEEIWSGSGDLRRHLDGVDSDLLIRAAYPRVGESWVDEEAEREMGLVLDVVRSVRNLRRERGLDASRWLEAYVVADVGLAKHAGAIEALARVRPLHIVAARGDAPAEGVATAILADAQVILPLAGAVDLASERANIEKQMRQAQGDVQRLEAQLANERFTSSAPEKVVAEARERLEAARSRLAGLQSRLAELG